MMSTLPRSLTSTTVTRSPARRQPPERHPRDRAARARGTGCRDPWCRQWHRSRRPGGGREKSPRRPITRPAIPTTTARRCGRGRPPRWPTACRRGSQRLPSVLNMRHRTRAAGPGWTSSMSANRPWVIAKGDSQIASMSPGRRVRSAEVSAAFATVTMSSPGTSSGVLSGRAHRPPRLGVLSASSPATLGLRCAGLFIRPARWRPSPGGRRRGSRGCDKHPPHGRGHEGLL